jgi:hypothetical protein
MTDWDGLKPWIGVQWEIRDAMEEQQLCDNLVRQLGGTAATQDLCTRLNSQPNNFSPNRIHTAPPCKRISTGKNKDGKDVPDHKAFRDILTNSLGPDGDPAVRVLAERLVDLAKGAGYDIDDPNVPAAEVLKKALFSPEQVVVYLNQLVEKEKDFHKNFWNGNLATLELHDRQREKFGPLGFERRELPTANTRLSSYQNRRVNSLIVEAICPEQSILPAPAYLSTKGVLSELFSQMKNEGIDVSSDPPPFDHVYIYASPVHSRRCQRQFIEFAWNMGWSVGPEQVTRIYDGDDMSNCAWIWDGTTAQVWCRSIDVWNSYEGIIGRLL